MAATLARCQLAATPAFRAPPSGRAGAGEKSVLAARRSRLAARPTPRRVRAAAEGGAAAPARKEGDGAKKKSSGAGKKPSGGDSKNADARKALARALESGEPVSGRVEVANRGGLILRIFDGRFRAFLPLSQMASSRTLRVKQTRTAPRTVTAPLASFDDEEEDFVPPPVASVDEPAPAAKGDGQKDATVAALESQVGKTIAVRVTAVENSKIVVSERALAMERGAGALQPGVRASGVVVSLSDFGAFVELSEDDPQAPRLEGLIHISELSWNRVSHPRDVVRVGDEVDVKVLDVVRADAATGKPARVTFSLKQLQADPLLETLDTIMPVAMPEPSVDEDELQDTPLPGLMDICANLLTEEGIDAVIPGRQAVEQRVVSQDLELWLTNAVVEDGYNLLARAGRQVQEIHVVTKLNRDSIKLAIKRATSALK